MEELKEKIKEVRAEIKKIKDHVAGIKQAANDLDLPGKVAEVCKEFGKYDYDGECNYHGDKLSIYMQRNYIRVKVDGLVVFECSLYDNNKGDVDLYKAGVWEIEIDDLLKKIPERRLTFQLQAEEYTLNQLKQQWGIK